MITLSEKTFEPLAKLPINNDCHSERSEESRIFRCLRSFTSFRMTKEPVLQEALLAFAITGWFHGQQASDVPGRTRP
jgi:hypothetical protein